MTIRRNRPRPGLTRAEAANIKQKAVTAAPAARQPLAITHQPAAVMPPLNEPFGETKATGRKRQSAPPKAENMANNGATLAKLATLASEIGTAWDAFQGADSRAFDKQLETAIKLAEAKKACADAPTPIPFQGWVEAHLTIAYETARALARIGSADDPAGALRAERNRRSAGMRETRARERSNASAVPRPRSDAAGAAGETETDAAVEARATPFQRAENALHALGTGAVELCRSTLAKLGQSPLPMSGPELATPGALKVAFSCLTRDEQGEFLIWAVDAWHVDRPQSDATPEQPPADPWEIPGFLKRNGQPPTVN